MRYVLAMTLALLVLGDYALAESSGSYDQRVNKGMSLISVFPGMTVTSTPLSVRVNSSQIPDNAVVERVSVITGAIATGNKATATIAVSTYNIKGPSMQRFAEKKWGGKGRPTVFDFDDLGGADVPVKGTWQISMTGNNVGIARATASHTVRQLKFEYRY